MRLNFEANTDPLDGVYVMLERFDELVAEAGEETARELTPELLAELDYTPPKRSYPSQYPIEWTSEKQRRAYWASGGFGAGIPHKRSGGLTAAWEVVTERTSTGFRLVVRNLADGARFVVGSLAKDIVAASRFQQRFHTITGWKLASPIVHGWMDLAQDMVQAKLGEKIAGLGVTIKRRAITPRLRR